MATPCGGGDQFRQLFFKVRLVTYPTNGIYNFDLAYEKLDITIEQILAGPPGALGYSFLDKTATELCHQQNATANNWVTSGDNGSGGFTPGVSFIAEEKTANILFSNNNIPCPQAAIIHFSPTAAGTCPPSYNIQCASADLFTVVVNAYPGETVQLKTISAIYQASGGDCTIPLTSTTPAIGTAVAPMLPIGTNNSSLEVRLKNPVPIAGGGFNVDVELANSSLTPNTLDIDYLEFVMKVTANQLVTLDIPGSFDRPSLPNSGNSIGDRFIQFIVPEQGWVLPAGTTQLIGTLTIKPQIANIGWNGTVSLLELGKSRVKTKTVPGGVKFCTSVALGALKSLNNIGDAICTYDNGGVKFTIEGIQTNDCAYPFTQKVKIGFKDTDPSVLDVLVLSALQFNLDIATTGTVNLKSTTMPMTGWNGCASAGCFSGTCSQYSTSSGLIQFSFCQIMASGSFNIVPDAYIELLFEGAGCIDAITITSLSLRRNGDATPCVPAHDQGPYLNIPICMGNIFGVVATELGAGVEATQVELAEESGNPHQPPGCSLATCPIENFIDTAGMGTGPSGAYGFCPCAACQYFKITPTKDDNPLNGVTTYDLVLISKHILAAPSLNSPYKMIAADANKSNSITTFDVVELRKLILGIYTDLPNNTSWRIVDPVPLAGHETNPFLNSGDFIKEFRSGIDKTSNPPSSNNFVAIKVGDVNNTAVANRPSGARPQTLLSWPNFRRSPGEVITIPVTYAGLEALEAIQMGLHFDPELLQLLSPSLGDLPDWTADAFNLARAAQGEIRTLWLPSDISDPEQCAKQGNVLFYLTFKVLGELPESGVPIWLDDAIMANAAWRTDGTECSLIRQTALSKRSDQPENPTAAITAICRPNPSSGALSFSVHAVKAGKARIALFGPYGVRMLAQDVILAAGEQEISLPEATQLPKGVYSWKVFSNGAQVQGHWVKL